jgi:peptidoglycan/LPS O-acetylase OafA/YrhL
VNSIEGKKKNYSPKKNLEVEGLRGLAILGVLAYHYLYRWRLNIMPQGVQSATIFKMGHFGVQLFFMISGFVILGSMQNSNNYFHFIKKRFLRLYLPLPIFMLIIYFVGQRSSVLEIRAHAKILNFIPSITLMDPRILNFFGFNLDFLTGVQWTLSVEIFFYFIAGFLYFKSHKIDFVSQLLFLCVLATALDHLPHQGSPFLVTLHKIFFIYGIPFLWFFLFGSSCWAIKIYREKKYFLYSLISGFAVLIFIYKGYRNSPEQYSVVYPVILFLAFELVFLYISVSEKPLGFLRLRILQFFGKISYELYLIHEVLGVTVLAFLTSKIGSASFHTYFIEVIVVAFVIISFTTILKKYVFDQLAQRLERRF